MRVPQRIVYATTSTYKRAENEALVKTGLLTDGTAISDLFTFDLRAVRIYERLEIRISAMVTAEVQQAYRELRVPCIVEHAGLVFEEYLGSSEDQQYPGGLTKPMWDALGDRFLTETHAGGRRAVARAVVAYCDGQKVETFTGETAGEIASAPRGAREFYWDTVFVPDDPTGPGNLTYAEIVEDPRLGLEYKVQRLSQSTKAITNFLEWLRSAEPAPLWPEGL